MLSGWTILLLLIFSFIRNPDEKISRAALGKQLFFDPILSSDHSISCASCHIPAFAFADTAVVSLGVKRRSGTRNTPSVMNLRFGKFFFWDGRAASLEEQALAPIANPLEMNLPVGKAILRLQKNKKYRSLFLSVFKEEPTEKNLAAALASFERTLETSDSPFDDWKVMEDENALSESAKKGFAIFNGKGQCSQCHFGSDFTNGDFRDIGLYNARNLNDSGRATSTGKTGDIGKFKIPGLRNISLTAPYMHNGMFKTLTEVIDYYNDPDKLVPDAINRDSLLSKPLGLSKDERKNLEDFLLSLTDKQIIQMF